MAKNYRSSRLFLSTLFVLTLVCGQSIWGQNEKKDDKTVVENTAKGRLPVIIIPGLIGSELVNKNTGEKVWFDLGRSKNDDLRLPISPNLKANKDNLVPSDILREIQLVRLTPKVEIYQKLIESLLTDGFSEGRIDTPLAGGDADTFYVFPYDWRLDNVENAQILVEKLENIRTKLNRPDLKFNVVAHSMGGLIARYAAMYGKADLTARTARPTWKGANYFNTISLIATPNSGATGALDSIINGFSLFGSGKLNLPFIQNLSRNDLFTIPSIFQLLPHTGTARIYNENLKPLRLDLYNPLVWEKYGWTAYSDADFAKKFDAGEQTQAKAYFRVVLLRAKQFQAALDARSATKNPVETYYIGAECRQTVDGMILRRDTKKGVWISEFEPAAYIKANGVKVTKEDTEKILLSPGDGVVPKRSLLASLLKLNINSSLILGNTPDSCSEHNRLTGNATVTKNILSVLNGKGIIVENTAAKVTK